MRILIGYLISLLLLANALAMLLFPSWWYHALPTVAPTGPLNVHFVRDIGCAYLVASLGLLAALRHVSWGWGAALAGVAWLTAHALLHFWDALAGRSEWLHLAQDFVGVIAVPAIILWVIWPLKNDSETHHV